MILPYKVLQARTESFIYFLLEIDNIMLEIKNRKLEKNNRGETMNEKK